MAQKVLIVGGVAGGASAAARLRRNDEEAQIVLFEKGDYISFANCGLPYYIGGSIKERSALLVQTPQAMKARFGLDIRVKSEVIAIDRVGKKVSVKNHEDGSIYEESYDVLVLSPGSVPLRPPIPGIESPNVYSLWNIPDTDAVKSHVMEKNPQSAVVIGGGFIGLEMAENLHELGIEVAVVEMASQVMAPIDYEMAAQVHNHMRQKGVNLYLEDGVKAFEDKEGRTLVHLQSGRVLEADMVMLSIGIRPQSELAKAAGLEINTRGAVVVDDYLKTSDPNIYAIGDVIEVTDFVGGFKTMIPLAGPANKQGRICADNISGRTIKYKGTQGTAIAKVFDLNVASTGLNEKTLNRLGKKIGEDYLVSITHSKSHAGYYPNSTMMAIKLIFDLEGKVLGAQIVGADGVDKRIDVIATAIRYGGTVADLTELELAYAPPFSSAKDPVNMAAYVAENILLDKTGVAQHYETRDFDQEKTILLDVRDLGEWDRGHIEGAVHIPVNSLRERLSELDKDKEIMAYCAIGLRGYIAARILKQHGFKKVRNVSGGYTTYSQVYCGPENPAGAHAKVNCIGVPVEKKETLEVSESGDVVTK